MGPERHRSRIDRADEVRAEEHEPRRPVGAHHDPVGPRAAPRHCHHPHLPGGGIEPADPVTLLHREPHAAVRPEDDRVRVARGRVRHREPGDLVGPPVDAADQRVAIAGVPGVPPRVQHHGVGIGAGVELDPVERTGAGVQDPDVVPRLSHEPDPAIGRHRGVPGAGALPRDFPFADDDGIGRALRREGRCTHEEQRGGEEKRTGTGHGGLHAVSRSQSTHPPRPGLHPAVSPSATRSIAPSLPCASAPPRPAPGAGPGRRGAAVPR